MQISSVRMLASLTLLAILTVACTPTQPVSVTQHNRIDSLAVAGSTVVIDSKDDSLRTADFDKALAQRLRNAGFSITDDAATARFVASMTAEVQEGVEREHVVRTPEFLVRRRLVTLQNGDQVVETERIYRGDRVDRFPYTLWPAIVSMTLTERETGKPAFEGEVTTQGSCGQMAALIGPMLDALFRNLRNESGTVSSSYVEVPTC
ncbi:MAG: hypothetical protein DHS20C03_24340 [Minwuia thermotolerans]|nr:MAG: hypothetical protein DHS20C03_24340 [Minwuia thermotolerans]